MNCRGIGGGPLGEGVGEIEALLAGRIFDICNTDVNEGIGKSNKRVRYGNG